MYIWANQYILRLRNSLNSNRYHDPRIDYRGKNPSRIDNLTDAVFGIAITLLIFNLSNPNSFTDLLTFTKTLPAFLISISFLVLIWSEHLRFSEIYTLNNAKFVVLNTLFVALVIFYVYPLRFLSLFLTSIFFNAEIGLSIQSDQVPFLMIYYGFIAAALYFILFLFYVTAHAIRGKLMLNPFEVFYTKAQKQKLVIMFVIPCISIALTYLLNLYSFKWASMVGGLTYCLYMPGILIWRMRYVKKAARFIVEN